MPQTVPPVTIRVLPGMDPGMVVLAPDVPRWWKHVVVLVVEPLNPHMPHTPGGDL